MKPRFQSKPEPLTSAHGFTTLFNVEIPVPALQSGWLHGREFTQPWDARRIAAKIGEGCWFSHYARDNREDDPDGTSFELAALAGFRPDGGSSNCNSELADLDPALLRPGRLVAHRDFELLAADEARQLAELLDVPAPRGDRVSLAEMFNQPNAPSFARPASPRRAMGFHTALQQT